MRCYFNLVSSHHTVTDEEGLEVADVEEARTFACEAVPRWSRRASPRSHTGEGRRSRPEMVQEPSCSRLALMPRSRSMLEKPRPKSSLRPSRRRMGPTLTTRQLDLTG